MSEYIITSEQLIEVFDKLHSWDFPEWLHEFVYTRKLFCPKLPEIVRCRDCDFSHEDELGNLRCHGQLTEPWDYYNDEPSDGVKVEPSGFCAWGERKEGRT